MTNLYSTHAKEFSDTRQSPWKGWSRLFELNDLKNFGQEGLDVLDLGCGNGRFLKELLRREEIGEFKLNSYVGVDNSEELLKIAESNYLEKDSKKNIKFLNLNLESSDWMDKLKKESDLKFNLVVAFGLTHHLKNNRTRSLIYKNSYELLVDSGIFCITFWQFIKNERLFSKAKDLGNQDYILPFGESGATRFAHYSNNEEIKMLETGNFQLISDFVSDGKSEDQNQYKIYLKNSGSI